jgi:predicted enzyme involved in methoxymalonyl-ACP biosynthesis
MAAYMLVFQRGYIVVIDDHVVSCDVLTVRKIEVVILALLREQWTPQTPVLVCLKGRQRRVMKVRNF